MQPPTFLITLPWPIFATRKNNLLTAQKPDVVAAFATPNAADEDLLRELARALRTIRYGSITLTVHDGRVVEIQKTERIRKGGSK
jgi:hypothetical protein